MDSLFVSLQEVGGKLGFTKNHCVRNIRKRFPDLITRHRDEVTGQLIHVIPADKEKLVIDSFCDQAPPRRATGPKGSAAERVRNIFEKEGWVVHLLTPQPIGTPDLIMYKGGIIRYREVKAPSDGVRKEQWAEIYRLRNLGCDAWICDDRGVDWPKVS